MPTHTVQVGGLLGGVKIARSSASLPLKVDVEPIAVTQDFLDQFSRQLVSVFRLFVD